LGVFFACVEFFAAVDILAAGVAAHRIRGHESDSLLLVVLAGVLLSAGELRGIKIRRVVFRKHFSF